MIKRRGGLPFAHLRDEMDDKIAQRERDLHKLEKRMAAQLKIRAKAAARAQAVARQADACRGILARCCVSVWSTRADFLCGPCKLQTCTESRLGCLARGIGSEMVLRARVSSPGTRPAAHTHTQRTRGCMCVCARACLRQWCVGPSWRQWHLKSSEALVAPWQGGRPCRHRHAPPSSPRRASR